MLSNLSAWLNLMLRNSEVSTVRCCSSTSREPQADIDHFPSGGVTSHRLGFANEMTQHSRQDCVFAAVTGQSTIPPNTETG